ncbi:MAG TPA: hypothetical protein PLW50_00095 [Smithellaceae bacterium]|jgi:hypothetical protein|nr:hypothetical protein [Smithellaceae bacterium]
MWELVVWNHEISRKDLHDKDDMLMLLARHASIKNTYAGVVVAEAIMGRSVADTVAAVWEWFFLQSAFTKLILFELNDHMIVFDKTIPAVVFPKLV